MQDKFLEAMVLAGKEFILLIGYAKSTWWPGRAIVAKAIKKRYEVIHHFDEASCKEARYRHYII